MNGRVVLDLEPSQVLKLYAVKRVNGIQGFYRIFKTPKL